MKYNFQKLKEICRTKDSIQMLQALIEAEAELREIDLVKWFEDNVYQDWTWEGMLKKFIEKEILGSE